jgi:competence protein ComEC
VALAVCAAAGALRPASLPLVMGAVLVMAALALRRPGLLCLGVGLLASTLAARSLAGLDGVEVRHLAAEVTLLSDPTPVFGGVQADVRLEGRRLELRADGSSAQALAPRLAGERVAVRGEVQAVSSDSPWLVARHISGRLRVFAVEGWEPGSLPTRLANGLRRTLTTGAAPLSTLQRSLYLGLVIGDDRAQPVDLADDFQGAGLTHLIAVSGQNVAFVLALAAPLLRRLRLWPRLGTTLLAIGMFGLMTRFEPSVLRASVMAALAVTTATIGSPASRVRVLALATAGLLLVDPLLVRSVGFQLSVAASAAIILLGPPLIDVLPGPTALRDPLAVTLAAQLGVAPVLLATFGPLPVASLPANLLAVPVAGLVMVWGLTAGVVAGLVGGLGAEVAHLPTRLMLSWLVEVAARAARSPLGQLGVPHVIGLGVGLTAVVGSSAVARHGPGSSLALRRAGTVAASLSVALAVVAAQAPPPLRTTLLPGVVRWHERSTEVVVVGGGGGGRSPGPTAVLSALRESGVGAIDLLVVADSSVPASLVGTIEKRHPIGLVVVVAVGGVGPLDTEARQVLAPRPSARLEVGALEVHLTSTADRVVVEARPIRTASGVARDARR